MYIQGTVFVSNVLLAHLFRTGDVLAFTHTQFGLALHTGHLNIETGASTQVRRDH